MTPNEKKYFEFCGTRPYFVTLAIVLVIGIVCLSLSLPFMISASICDGNPEAIEQQNISEDYKKYSQSEEGLSKAYTELNIMTRFLVGIAAVTIAVMVPITDEIRCRRIRKHLREAREAKRANKTTEEAA